MSLLRPGGVAGGLLLTVLVVGLCCCPTLVDAMRAPPEFTLDLATPPEQRWLGAVSAVLRVHPWDSSFGAVFAAHNATLFDNLPLGTLDSLWATLEQHFPITAREIAGLSAEFTASGHTVSREYLAGWVYFHELAHTDLATDVDSRACTAVVTLNIDQEANGSTTHVANMDQSPEAVRNITLRVHIEQAGVRVAEGVDWYWITTGLSRMVRRGVASVQENWRDLGVQNHSSTLAAIRAGATPQILVFRQALLTVPCDGGGCTPSDGGFRWFVQAMRKVTLGAPFYVIVAGASAADREGVVMARSATAVDSELWIGEDTQPWYLTQTNYDRCRAAPPGVNGSATPCDFLPDDPTDPRRTAAEAALVSVGPVVGTTAMGLYAVASTYPVHNPHTAYTAVMNAADGTLTAFVRTAMCPESPGTTTVDGRYCLANRTAPPLKVREV
eukprot:m.155097 g.155097  ORF g.155097 m.155097 type:complete len:442 (+) comp14395_c2_seq1:13-1338(+)